MSTFFPYTTLFRSPLQLRLTEMFAHLPMFNKKYSVGLILGVAIANIRSEFGIYDVVFGTLHTALSLLIVFFIVKKSDSLLKKMIINTAVFTGMSFILALIRSEERRVGNES